MGFGMVPLCILTILTILTYHMGMCPPSLEVIPLCIPNILTYLLTYLWEIGTQSGGLFFSSV